ncbi:NAD-dependent epimerase/dehydratase family protein [Pleomorphovibrio marinus]|uniref:NAD-dependent epimerase/dehydratase family protein n=1 Tax=Pleomorphovibrio marinus TaxID=2164132 RepID=UPI000E0BA835|nr:NAD-dependent epimerase/dehydratase family protein [Pleomorphovibrio marinus]
MKKAAIVTGASGLVGMQLLHQLFSSKDYQYIVALSRRELALKHSKLVQVVTDFKELPQINLPEKLREKNMGGDLNSLITGLETSSLELHGYCALGTTLKQAGSKEKFREIDHDYVIDFASWCKKLGTKKFLYVSALGADKDSKFFYNRVKGEIEADLKNISFDYLGIFRPSVLSGNRRESRLGEEIGRVVMNAVAFLGLFRKYKPIEGVKVAKCMVHHANADNAEKFEILFSKDMQQF